MRKQSKDGHRRLVIDVHRRSSPEEIDVEETCACSRFGGTPLTKGQAAHHTKPRAYVRGGSMLLKKSLMISASASI
jgi:hypothetical protein